MSIHQWQVYAIAHKKCVVVNGLQKRNCVIPTNFAQPVLVGDYVTMMACDGLWVIETILPRQNYLIRPKCVNVDWVVIVYPVNKIKKYYDLLWWILMYQSQNHQVIIVFTKTDQYGLPDDTIYDLLSQLKVRSYCYREKTQLLQLCKKLQKKLVVLAGYSGAGKSTFMNHLDHNLQLKTNTLTTKNTGKHTTTTSCIYEVLGIKWIDTPGFGSLHFAPNKLEIATGWALWSQLGLNCKHNDCLHNIKDQNCAIYQALLKKQISAELYNIYMHLLKQGG